MRLVQTSLVGRTLADHRLATDQRRLVGAFGRCDRGIDSRHIMTVHIPDDIPAISLEPARCIVREPAPDIPVDRNTVVVVQRNQLVQLPGTGQRTGFVRNTFHQATVAQKDIRIVIDDIKTRLVEFGSQQLFSQRHTDRIGNPLSQRASRRIDTGRDMHFRMTRRFGMELAELADIVHGKIVTCQMQQRILQHRAMSVGQNEAVTIEPSGIGRIMPVMSGPQRNGNIRHTHRHARMSGIGFLDRIHRQRADRVGHFRNR